MGTTPDDGEQIRQALTEQIASSVQWAACVQALVAAGCDTFLELGTGQTLTKLVCLIAPDVSALAADSPQKIEAFVEQHARAQSMEAEAAGSVAHPVREQEQAVQNERSTGGIFFDTYRPSSMYAGAPGDIA